jgi:aldehyde:ferredoxin oxidoreductase
MLTDSMALCIMPNITSDQKMELLRAVTGWNTGWVEMLEIGERILTTMRLFNLREGFSAADDVLPKRYHDRKTDGVLSTKDPANQATLARARDYYYYYMGWNEQGVPTPATLARLGIDAPASK